MLVSQLPKSPLLRIGQPHLALSPYVLPGAFLSAPCAFQRIFESERLIFELED